MKSVLIYERWLLSKAFICSFCCRCMVFMCSKVLYPFPFLISARNWLCFKGFDLRYNIIVSVCVLCTAINNSSYVYRMSTKEVYFYFISQLIHLSVLLKYLKKRNILLCWQSQDGVQLLTWITSLETSPATDPLPYSMLKDVPLATYVLLSELV